MKVFEANENLNKMTQVVGFIADKHSNDLFSTKGMFTIDKSQKKFHF